MALYKTQSPYNAALQGMQGAAQTTSSMTKKQEVKEGKKTFGGAIGSMVQGGTLGLSAAELFSGGEATSAMWSGLKGAFGGAAEAGATTGVGLGAVEAGTGIASAMAPAAMSMASPVATAVGTTALPAGVASMPLGGMGAIEGGAAALASGGELAAGLTTGAEVAGGLSSAAPAAGAAGPIGWAALGIGALASLASYYL